MLGCEAHLQPTHSTARPTSSSSSSSWQAGGLPMCKHHHAEEAVGSGPNKWRTLEGFARSSMQSPRVMPCVLASIGPMLATAAWMLVKTSVDVLRQLPNSSNSPATGASGCITNFELLTASAAHFMVITIAVLSEELGRKQ